MSIELHDVSARYGAQAVLGGLTLSVSEGEMLALLGPSGSGKSTILFILAGFHAPDGGKVRIEGRDVRDVPPGKRGIGMVFQDQALWPHMTVEGHLDFVLKARRVAKAERRERIREILEIVELLPMAGKVPSTVSGGEAQRLALARALVTRPKILLLDEPLGALDRRLREKMIGLISRIHSRFRTTTIYVTHDYDEALSLADRVAVLHEGRLEQVGTPDEVYRRPANARVAEISGPVSLVDGEKKGDRVRLPWGEARAEGAEGRVVVPLRVEQVTVEPGGGGVVRAARFRGGRWEVEVEVGGVRVTGCSATGLAEGDAASVSAAEPVWAFGGKADGG
ncbi:MAG: ABC transporter ATP-binding protein [Planctomycetota bacterium]|jgi:putative spermidine/putrescine transport system ATP-binding protein